MAVTYDEKLRLAATMRTTSVVQSKIVPELQSNLESVLCEERFVPTREGDAHIYVVSPKSSSSVLPLYINLHGGGFVRGYEQRDTVFCALIAGRLGCKVIDIDYKLAPEYPFPAALNESYDVVKWAFRNAEELHIDKERVAVGGHSAGGNLTAGIALMANQSREFEMKLQILDYPFLDAITDPDEKITETDVLTVERMKAFNELYVEKDDDKSNPFVSLVRTPPEMLFGLPPALIITAGMDCLRFEAEKYAVMLIQAGVEVRMRKFLNSNHAFVVHALQEYREAQELIIRALGEVFLYSPRKGR